MIKAEAMVNSRPITDETTGLLDPTKLQYFQELVRPGINTTLPIKESTFHVNDLPWICILKELNQRAGGMR